MNVVRALMAKPAVYANNARNTAMYIVQFSRNAKGGLKPTVILENNNDHINLDLPEPLMKQAQQLLRKLKSDKK